MYLGLCLLDTYMGQIFGKKCLTVVFLPYFEYFLSWNFGDCVLRMCSGLKWKESVLVKATSVGQEQPEEACIFSASISCSIFTVKTSPIPNLHLLPAPRHYPGRQTAWVIVQCCTEGTGMMRKSWDQNTGQSSSWPRVTLLLTILSWIPTLPPMDPLAWQTKALY